MKYVRGCLIVVAGIIACVFLAGCPVLLPPLGYERGSRGNLPGGPPEWIVAGTTSREDVLLRLGSPDGQVRDGRWIG